MIPFAIDGVLTANPSINTLIYKYNFHFFIRYPVDWPQISGCQSETMRSGLRRTRSQTTCFQVSGGRISEKIKLSGWQTASVATALY